MTRVKKTLLITFLLTTLLSTSHATTSYETMSGIMFMAATLVCIYIATTIKIPSPFSYIFQLLFFTFSLIFLFSGFGATVQITSNQTDASSPVTTSVATGYKASVYLFWISIALIAIFLIWMLFKYMLSIKVKVPNNIIPEMKGEFKGKY